MSGHLSTYFSVKRLLEPEEMKKGGLCINVIFVAIHFKTNSIDKPRTMQRMKVGPSTSPTSAEATQDDIDDNKARARTTVIVTFAAFGAIVLALRVGKSVAITLTSDKTSLRSLVFIACLVTVEPPNSGHMSLGARPLSLVERLSFS